MRSWYLVSLLAFFALYHTVVISRLDRLLATLICKIGFNVFMVITDNDKAGFECI